MPLPRVRVEGTAPQCRFWQAPAKFRAYIGGRGAGKTFAGAIEVLRQPAGSTGMVVAPTYPMLRDATLPMCEALWRQARRWGSFNKADMAATLANGTRVLFRSGDRPDRLRGPNLGWAWLDEGDYLAREVWLIVIATLRGLPGRAWITSTPKPGSWRKEIFAAKGDFATVRAPTTTNPHNPDGFVEALKASYSEHWQRQEIEGLDCDESNSLLIPLAWWERCAGAAHVPSGFVRIACDLAKGAGGDRAVVLVRDDGGIYELEWSRDWDKSKVAAVVAGFKRKYRVPDHRISYDAGGIGDDFHDYLASHGIRAARAYRGGHSPPNKPGSGQATNLRSYAACLGLAPRLDPALPDLTRRPVNGIYPVQDTFAVKPRDVELMRKEIKELRYELAAGGARKLELKEDYVKRLDSSPDFADTLIQSFAFVD